MPTISIKDIIGTPNAILQKFGLKVFSEVSNYVSANKKVIVSFKGVNNVTSGFLNASLGNLYKKFGESKVEKIVFLTDIGDEDWKEKLEDAKSLALDPEKAKVLDKAIAELFV